MKKIGILSSWSVPNYGSFWQMYALQQAAADLCPEAEVRQIAYLHRTHYGMYYDLFWKPNGHWPVSRYFYKCLFQRMAHYDELKETRKFLSYYDAIPHTEPLQGDDLKRFHFDAVILGSDIIWDYSIEAFGHDPFLFGVGLDSGTVISYAPSFGTVKKDRTPPDYVVQGLKRLKHISVRDQNSADLVKQYTGREAEVVIDPTFLIDFERIPQIYRREEKPYIVVYGSHFSEALIQGAADYAKAHGLKLICLDSGCDRFDWCDEVIPQKDLDPFAWVSYFKYADSIFTCTYHGLMFGLIFRKPLIFSPTQFILDKASSLIRYLELQEPLVGGGDGLPGKAGVGLGLCRDRRPSRRTAGKLHVVFRKCAGINK